MSTGCVTCNEVPVPRPVPLCIAGVEPNTKRDHKSSVGSICEQDVPTPPYIDRRIWIENGKAFPPDDNPAACTANAPMLLQASPELTCC